MLPLCTCWPPPPAGQTGGPLGVHRILRGYSIMPLLSSCSPNPAGYAVPEAAGTHSSVHARICMLAARHQFVRIAQEQVFYTPPTTPGCPPFTHSISVPRLKFHEEGELENINGPVLSNMGAAGISYIWIGMSKALTWDPNFEACNMKQLFQTKKARFCFCLCLKSLPGPGAFLWL